MKISGFTFARNATKLFYPIKPSILSILPIVDEFVIALGKGDPDDHTRAEIESIGSEKIRIVDTEWDLSRHQKNSIYAEQTDLAKGHCSGDWLFYLQCDEVVHEKYLPRIVDSCQRYLRDSDVEGLLFEYTHFWGDFDHCHRAHTWYPREIRIIRNVPEIHSYQDAQSFRLYQEFDSGQANAYFRRENSRKLKVARIYAGIYHYGWVRPPEKMSNKVIATTRTWWNGRINDAWVDRVPQYFDYGPMQRIPPFKGSHPRVMEDWISRFNWQDKLQFSGPRNKGRVIHKHEKLKYRLLSYLEYKFLGGRQIGGFRNYEIVRSNYSTTPQD